ncbi:MAG: ribbon-helix-helix protein, CopG family [Phycisphaeraceae bacterium]
MPEPKDKFSISMDTELVQRLDAIAEARDEARSTVIERIVRHGLAEEESFLRDMENPVDRAIVDIVTDNPGVLRTIASLVRQQLTDEQLAGLRQQAARGRERQATKKKGVRRAT